MKNRLRASLRKFFAPTRVGKYAPPPILVSKHLTRESHTSKFGRNTPFKLVCPGCKFYQIFSLIKWQDSEWELQSDCQWDLAQSHIRHSPWLAEQLSSRVQPKYPTCLWNRNTHGMSYAISAFGTYSNVHFYRPNGWTFWVGIFIKVVHHIKGYDISISV